MPLRDAEVQPHHISIRLIVIITDHNSNFYLYFCVLAIACWCTEMQGWGCGVSNEAYTGTRSVLYHLHVFKLESASGEFSDV